VVSTTPVGTDIPVKTTITITFDDTMNTDSVDCAFSISPKISGTFGWTEKDTVMTFIPCSDLDYSTVYRVELARRAIAIPACTPMDSSGNILSKYDGWQFITASEKNNPPDKPREPSGPSPGQAGISYKYLTANTLTGEPISEDSQLTILSGGQSRALMVADIAIISDSPVVLIDEIENAGIRKREALRLLSGKGKIVLVVTHDPVLALMTERRIVMKNGGITGIIETAETEREVCAHLSELDEYMMELSDAIRCGRSVEGLHLDAFCSAGSL